MVGVGVFVLVAVAVNVGGGKVFVIVTVGVIVDVGVWVFVWLHGKLAFVLFVNVATPDFWTNAEYPAQVFPVIVTLLAPSIHATCAPFPPVLHR